MSECPVCGGAGSSPVDTAGRRPPVRKCDECGARYASPMPSEDALEARYDREHRRGKWKERFDAKPASEVERRAELMTELAGDPGRVLDVGCGDGRFLDAMADRGWATVGVEISASAAALVSDRHAVLVGSLDALPARATFDAVTFWDVLEHVPDPGETVRSASDKLSSGGLAAVTMPNAGGVTRALQGPRWAYYDFETYGHLHHLAPAHVQRLLIRAGLEPFLSETRGSVDLRYLPEVRGWRAPPGSVAWLLDKVSGALARVTEPGGWGDTLLVVGRKP